VASDGLTDNLFTVEGPVDLGGVDVGDAQVQGPVDGADRLAVVEGTFAGVGPGHGHGAEADTGDVQAPEVCRSHDLPRSLGMRRWRRQLPGNRRPSRWRSHCWSVYRQPTTAPRSATYREDVDNRAEVKDFLTTRRARLTRSAPA
jgi:hypothetical protein